MKLVFLTVFYFIVFMIVVLVDMMGGVEEAIRIRAEDPSALACALGINLVAAQGVYLFWRNARGVTAIGTPGVSEVAFDTMMFRHPKGLMPIVVIGGLIALAGSLDAAMLVSLARDLPNAKWGQAILLTLGNVIAFRVAMLFQRGRYLCAACFAGGFIYHFV